MGRGLPRKTFTLPAPAHHLTPQTSRSSPFPQEYPGNASTVPPTIPMQFTLSLVVGFSTRVFLSSSRVYKKKNGTTGKQNRLEEEATGGESSNDKPGKRRGHCRGHCRGYCREMAGDCRGNMKGGRKGDNSGGLQPSNAGGFGDEIDSRKPHNRPWRRFNERGNTNTYPAPGKSIVERFYPISGHSVRRRIPDFSTSGPEPMGE